jgi:hypothetical protein
MSGFECDITSDGKRAVFRRMTFCNEDIAKGWPIEQIKYHFHDTQKVVDYFTIRFPNSRRGSLGYIPAFVSVFRYNPDRRIADPIFDIPLRKVNCEWTHSEAAELTHVAAVINWQRGAWPLLYLTQFRLQEPVCAACRITVGSMPATKALAWLYRTIMVMKTEIDVDTRVW